MKVICAGGGTAGSIMPLVAIAEQIKISEKTASVLFIGTRQGKPERDIVEMNHFLFLSIFCGKLRRYFDIRNITDPLLVIIGFFQSLKIIITFKPDIIIGAGGYVSVPVILAGWILQKKIVIHQQDIRPSFTNILLKRFVDRITVCFDQSLRFFPKNKTVAIGNPVRGAVLKANVDQAYTVFNLNKTLPIVLIIGGGTGSLGLNVLIRRILPELIQITQVIHLTGQGKRVTDFHHVNYQQFEFLHDELLSLIKVANVIISRAGFSALSEFSVLKKPVILFPLPQSHQEDNARYFADHQAALTLNEQTTGPSDLLKVITSLLADEKKRSAYSENIGQLMKPNAASLFINEINTVIHHEHQ
jgi:UDP-N-acetylglucosamine--N-acetylmuramyl-(pentapeptide) pyrophosphoryl-undecaprenol N-acetylglucosamine transferase